MSNIEYIIPEFNSDVYLSDKGYEFSYTLPLYLEAKGTLPVEECHVCNSKGIMEYKITTPNKTYSFCKKCGAELLKLLVILEL